VGHVGSKGDMMNAYRNVIAKHERKEPLGRPKRRPRLENNIKMNSKFEIRLLLACTARNGTEYVPPKRPDTFTLAYDIEPSHSLP
jgi:hypothetical protein